MNLLEEETDNCLSCQIMACLGKGKLADHYSWDLL